MKIANVVFGVIIFLLFALLILAKMKIIVYLEAIVIGLITGVIGLSISTGLMLNSPDFSFSKYSFWPQVFLSFFITGSLIHLVFEYFNLNKNFCCQSDRYFCV